MTKELRLIIPHNFFIELSDILHNLFVSGNLLVYTSEKKEGVKFSLRLFGVIIKNFAD